jgi:hypothetical protein
MCAFCIRRRAMKLPCLGLGLGYDILVKAMGEGSKQLHFLWAYRSLAGDGFLSLAAEAEAALSSRRFK